MCNTSTNTSGGRYNGYRMLSFLVPLNAPSSTLGRLRNLKLRHLLRWFGYGGCRSVWDYFLMSPKAGTRLRYGALCVRFKRLCKAEAVAEQGMVQELLRRLRAENLCSALYVLDDNGVGEASLIAAMSVAGNAGPLAIKVSELNGKEVFGGHVPYFARQSLSNMVDRPVEAYSAVLSDYEKLFGH